MNSRICALLGTFGVVAHCQGQGTIQITFDGAPLQPPGTSYGVRQYYESNMSFRPIGPSAPGNQFTRTGAGISFFPHNGTAYLQAGLGDSLVFGFLDGSLFGLDSVDLAEYSAVVPDVRTVHFVGYRPDGSTVTTDLTTDGIIDGTGPLKDFQTFNFQGFTGLSRVEIPTYGWSLDNLQVSYGVPEPRSAALLLAGGLVLWALRFRQSKPGYVRRAGL